LAETVPRVVHFRWLHEIETETTGESSVHSTDHGISSNLDVLAACPISHPRSGTAVPQEGPQTQPKHEMIYRAW